MPQDIHKSILDGVFGGSTLKEGVERVVVCFLSSCEYALLSFLGTFA